MPVVVWWGIAALLAGAGVGGGAYVAGQGAADAASASGDAAQKTNKLAQTVVIGGALYMLYRTAQKAGAAR